MTREADIQADIRLALGREPDLVLWRNQVGKAHHASGHTVPYGLCRGSSDLIGILMVPVWDESGRARELGRFFALEIKTPVGRLSHDQKLFLNLVRSRGGFAAVARSTDEARAALSRARRGDCE